jgi:phytoene dehydrogenase-like protein
MSTKFATVYCDDCKHEFSMDSVDIKETTMNLGGQALKLVYFTCPKCNKIYRITLKDKRYEELKEDLERTKTRIRKNRGSRNDEFARTLNSMVTRKHERMRNHLTKLNDKFPGTFTFVASENNHEDKIITYLP